MLTIQEMFNLAWNGLKAQGFQRAMQGLYCAYVGDDGKRCAWGHVDPGLGPFQEGAVAYLAKTGVGLAAHLDEDGLAFAARLQEAHDKGVAPESMEANLRDLAAAYSLTIPGET